MDMLIIRKASLQDMEILLRFEQGVIHAERPYDITLKNDPIKYYDLEEMINATHIEIVVAQSGNEVIGCGYARIENAQPFLKHAKSAYLGFMYVKPEHRGKGINKKVIEVLKEWVSSQGVTEFRLEVYINNLPAIRAYEKIGFTGHIVEMRLMKDKICYF